MGRGGDVKGRGVPLSGIGARNTIRLMPLPRRCKRMDVSLPLPRRKTP